MYGQVHLLWYGTIARARGSKYAIKSEIANYSVVNFYIFIYFRLLPTVRNDHTKVTAPLPVCSAKLSTFGPG